MRFKLLPCYVFRVDQDCSIRYLKGISNVSDLEKQAEGNLRLSIAVVGLLEDMDTFYEMLSDRVAYLNTSAVAVEGSRHSTSSEAKNACKNKFKEPNFQRELMERSEAIAAIVRLYKVAQEVNKFQREELSKCRNINSSYA